MEKQNFQEHILTSFKELRKHEVFLYLSHRYRNRQKHNQRFKLFFFQNKFTTWQIKLNIYIRKTNLFLINIINLVLSRNAKKIDRDQIIQVLSLCLKRHGLKTFESNSCKKLFFEVHVIATACFDEFFDSM